MTRPTQDSPIPNPDPSFTNDGQGGGGGGGGGSTKDIRGDNPSSIGTGGGGGDGTKVVRDDDPSKIADGSAEDPPEEASDLVGQGGGEGSPKPGGIRRDNPRSSKADPLT